MEAASVLLTARVPDPKLVRAGLAPFHVSRDGTTTTSASGFVLLHEQEPVVVASAAAVYPLLQQRRRQLGSLAGASHHDLAPGAHIQAILAGGQQHERTSGCSERAGGRPMVSPEGANSSNSSGGGGSSSGSGGSGSLPTPAAVDLQLVGVAEMPEVRQALLQLLAAPSIAGPAGWQVGWLLHRQGQLQLPGLSYIPLQQRQQALPPWSTGADSASEPGSGGASKVHAPAGTALASSADMLAVACHLAVLCPVTADGAAALQRIALPWPAAAGAPREGSHTFDAAQQQQQQAMLQRGQPLVALGAPFGALAPGHFQGFLATGTVSAVLAADSNSSGGNSVGNLWTAPALLLSDVRCSPGMEGGPVFAAGPAAAAVAPAATAAAAPAGCCSSQQQQRQQGRRPVVQQLAGMLLPPLKAPAAQVEFAAVAPAAAVAAAAARVLQHCTDGTSSSSRRPSSVGGPAASTTVVAVAAAAAGRHGLTSLPSDAVAAALQGVVAVATGGSWATGVLVSSAGHVLTNAHLLQPAAAPVAAEIEISTGGGSGSSGSSGGSHGMAVQPIALLSASAASRQAHAPVQVLLPASTSSSGSTSGSTGSRQWVAADVLYIFHGPLDLAVLQLQQPQQQQQGSRTLTWHPLALAQQPPRPGQAVCVVGFPAFNPRWSGLGPVVTAGNLAKVVRLPSSGRPAMLLTTAAVHSGASGGAVIDADSGQLLGLVTSNAKHSSTGGSSSSGRGRGGGRTSDHTVLPHLNFSIPSAQLLPVVAGAQAAARAVPSAGQGAACPKVGATETSATAGGDANAATIATWHALDASAAGSSELQQVWRLGQQRRPPQPQAQQQGQQAQAGRTQQAGDAFGGAAPPAKLSQFLEHMRQQQQPQAKL